MQRSTTLRKALVCAGVPAALGLLLSAAGAFTRAGVAGLLLGAIAIGCAAGAVAGYFLMSTSRQIRDLRRRVEALLQPVRGERGFSAASDELAALGSALELASRQVLVVVEALQRESARLEAILGSMVEGVVAVDPLMRITFVNRAFAEVMGAALPVASGTPLVQVARDHAFLEMFTSVLETGERLQKRLVLTAAGTRSFEVQVGSLAGDPQRGAIAMLYDVTELERLERVRKDFVANVSHELRTPLAAVCGYAETLLEGAWEDPQHRRKFAGIILGKSRQLSRIVSDLLALSALENDRLPAPQPISLKESIESALRTVEPIAQTRGVRLVWDAFEDQKVLAHDVHLEQVFVNLLDNAIKYSRPEGEVRIELGGAPDRAVVRVCDTGLGIPSRDLPRIFERFYRVDKARSRATGGTGLGLSIVKHAVEQMGGTVSVESRLGHGSIFTVALPPLGNNGAANRN